MIIFSPKRQTTNYMILEVLGENPPLSIKELHTLIKTRFPTKITYHGIYERVNDLLAIDVLLKKNTKIQINPLWIDQTERFFNSIKTNYNVQNRLSDLMEDNKNMLLHFNTLGDFDKYMHNFEDRFIEDAKNHKENMICMRIRHRYWPILYMKRELDFLKKIQENNIKYYLMLGGTTALDKYAYNFYKRANVNMATVPIKSVFSSVRVYNDLIFLKIYPPTLFKEIKETFKNTQDMEHIDIEKFHKLVSIRAPFSVLVMKNNHIVKKFRDQILSLFSHCLLDDDLKQKEISEIKSLIVTAMNNIRPKFALSSKLTSLEMGERVKEIMGEDLAFIYLNTPGCSRAKKHGRCPMCNISLEEEDSPKDMYISFLSDFNKIDFRNYPRLRLFVNSNFFNDEDVQPDMRNKILKRVAGKKEIKELLLGTNPEFITDEKIKTVKHILKDKKVTIDITLDIKDDKVRELIKRGFSLEHFEKAVKILEKYGCGYSPYVCIKPPFLTEEESIKMAAETIKYVIKFNPKCVHIEPMAIQRFTILELLKQNNLYRPAYLWTIIEILRGIDKLKKKHGKNFCIKIRGEFFSSSSEDVSHNCQFCDSRIKSLLKEFSENQDINIFKDILSLKQVKEIVENARDDPGVLKDLNCRCQIDWLKEIEETQSIPLAQLDKRIKYNLELCRPYESQGVE